jgi:hypothetical protein
MAINAISVKKSERNRRRSVERNAECRKSDGNSVEGSSVELIFKFYSLHEFQVTGVAIFRGGLKNGNSLVVALTL